MSVPVGCCLQCEQSREEVRVNQTICGIEEGYEYKELVVEWPRHHWRDWSDAELKQAGIKPDFFGEYRRWSALCFQYVACDHTERGHDFATEDIYWGDTMAVPKGVCRLCDAKIAEGADHA